MATSELGIISIQDPIDYSKLQLRKWNTKSKEGEDGGVQGIQFLFLTYAKQRLQLRLPKLSVPFGAISYRDNIYVDLLLKSNDLILVKLQELDVEIISLIHKTFPQVSIDDIINSFTSSVKLNMYNPAFGPTLRIKLAKDKDDDYTFSLYSSRKDDDGNYVQFDPTCDEEVKDIIHKRAEMSSIIELSGVWYNVSEKKFGTTWKLVQAKLFEQPGDMSVYQDRSSLASSAISESTYAFVGDPNDESDDGE